MNVTGRRARNRVLVTFDLFSALTDSRTGGAAAFGEIATRHDFAVTGEQLYDVWDRRNKELQRSAIVTDSSFHDLSLAALRWTYHHFDLPRGSVDADLARLEESMAQWPLWPDIARPLTVLARQLRVGILSNVDDVLARRTRAHALLTRGPVLSSQRLGAYKPSPAIYRAAVAHAAPGKLIHVAASGRDVRGALEAGITTIRLVRSGHAVDPAGPRPPIEVDDAADLAAVIKELSG